MGHSLGSHIAGQAGRTFEDETGKLLPRITGFDPAKVTKFEQHQCGDRKLFEFS
jgi:hypothetical protein